MAIIAESLPRGANVCHLFRSTAGGERISSLRSRARHGKNTLFHRPLDPIHKIHVATGTPPVAKGAFFLAPSGQSGLAIDIAGTNTGRLPRNRGAPSLF